jgi:hypothetical protein
MVDGTAAMGWALGGKPKVVLAQEPSPEPCD